MIASGPSVRQIADYDWIENHWTIVAINNAWKATDLWRYWIATDDFQGEKPQPRDDQIIPPPYEPQLRIFGGQAACGYSVTLNASYWALASLKPSVIGFLGADMNYTPDAQGNTHFYGVGYDIKHNAGRLPDPDQMVKRYGKGDPDYLRRMYQRFADQALYYNKCRVVNFSDDENTRLPYAKAKPGDLR